MTRHVLCFVLGFALAAGAVVWIAAGDPEWTLSQGVRFYMVFLGSVIGAFAAAASATLAAERAK